MSISIKGKLLDDETRCEHYHSEKDIIAIKLKCCQTYYPCISCHNETTNHKAEVWLKTERDTKAILCGSCKTELTINEYFACESICPNCTAAFNPKCENHYHFYFEM